MKPDQLSDLHNRHSEGGQQRHEEHAGHRGQLFVPARPAAEHLAARKQ